MAASLARLLACLSARAAVAGPDADLVARFRDARDEAAFAELVRRHGPAVYRVCRRLVGPAAADDAFQATFLVLATRADSVRAAGSVGGWLVGVAGRVARQMRAANLRRNRHETAYAADPGRRRGGDAPPFDLAEQLRILDEELARLPDRVRGPVVLCLLQGRTYDQAAADLGGRPRTVRRRVDEGKRLLRLRLERRGVVPAVAAALAAGAGEVATAVPPALGPATVAAVFDFLAGGAATTAVPAALAKGVVTAMIARKLVALMAAAAVGLTAVGVGAGGAGDGPGPATKPPDALVPPAVPKSDDRIPPQALRPAPAQDAAASPPQADGPSGHAPPNFVVSAPTKELARKFGEEAERHRREKSLEWLGAEMPRWPRPCPLKVAVSPGSTGGATTFTFGNDKDGKPAVLTQEVKIFGAMEALLTSTLPHEVTHTVLAHHFGRPIPRWADEGICILSESAAEQRAHDVRCREILNQGRGIPLRHLFAMREYPSDMVVTFAQGYSVCRFLLDYAPRPALGADGANLDDRAVSRRALLLFVKTGLDKTWNEAAKIYGFDTADQLEDAWLASFQPPPPADGKWATAPSPGRLDPAPAAPGGGFVVANQAPAVTRALVNELAFQRRVMADKWVGGRVPVEPNHPIPVEYHPNSKTHGAAWLNVHGDEKGRYRPDRMTLSGSLAEVLDRDIPQLMVRAVYAEKFGKNLPGWALTGVPALEAPPAEQRSLDATARELVSRGQALRLAAFFADANAFLDGTKAQGHSVARFLLTRTPDLRATISESGSVGRLGDDAVAALARSPHFSAARYGLVTFLSFETNWNLAAKEVYGFRDVDDLEAAWVAWLKSPASKAGLPAADAPAPPSGPPLIPPTPLDGDARRAVPPGYTRMTSRAILMAVDYDPARRGDVREVRVLASRDEGRTWHLAATATPPADKFTYSVNADGAYWLTLQTVYKDGREEPETGKVTALPPDLKVFVDTVPPGGPDRVGTIIIKGNTVTADRVIRNQLGLVPGDVLQYPKLDEARNNMIRTGLFDMDDPPTVMAVPRTDGSNVQDIEVRVKETRTGSVMLNANVNSNAGKQP